MSTPDLSIPQDHLNPIPKTRFIVKNNTDLPLHKFKV
jgi:hypothetical protein